MTRQMYLEWLDGGWRPPRQLCGDECPTYRVYGDCIWHSGVADKIRYYAGIERWQLY